MSLELIQALHIDRHAAIIDAGGGAGVLPGSPSRPFPPDAPTPSSAQHRRRARNCPRRS
jgi:hypothetical protein